MIDINICSVSGGADSTALYSLMQEYHGKNFIPIFADTGHEHPVTVNYVKNLHVMADGPEVKVVRADFSKVLAKKRSRLLKQYKQLPFKGKNHPAFSINARQTRARRARTVLKFRPTGRPFLDMMLWKGRAPSTKAQFCTEHLKLWPILFWLEENYPRDQYRWIMHTGIRAGESKRRSKMQPFAWNDFFDCLSVLPMLYESKEDEMSYLEQKGIPPNPLYALGFGRVGCYPCIHANKVELSLLPDWAWDRLNLYEDRLNRSWFPAGILPGMPAGHIPTINEVREWCLTTRGGKQYDLFKTVKQDDAPSCMTGWISCE